MEDRGEAIATAARLTDAVNTMAAEVSSLGRYGRHNRRMIWITIISVVLDVVLTVGIFLVAVQARDAHSTAAQVRATQFSGCEAGNVTRGQQVQLWDYLLSLPTATKPTSAQLAERAKFRTYVHATFAPRNCDLIKKVK